MPQIVISSHLDDAHQLLNSAKGLPDTISGRRQRDLFLRAAIVFNWLAVEESAKTTLRKYEAKGYPERRPQKLAELIIRCLAFRLVDLTRFDLSDASRPRLLADEESNSSVRNTLQRCDLLEDNLAAARQRFDSTAFHRFRKLRNDLVHCNAGTMEPSISDVQALYEYCKRMIGEIEDKKVLHEGYDLRHVEWGQP